jgi:hypothetical protein
MTGSIRFSAAVLCWLLSGVPVLSQADEGHSPRLTIKRLVAVDYPTLARRAEIQGKVELTLLVSEQGAVAKVLKEAGSPLLLMPLEKATMEWQFDRCKGDCQLKISAEFILDQYTCKATEYCPSSFEFDAPANIKVKAKRLMAIID